MAWRKVALGQSTGHGQCQGMRTCPLGSGLVSSILSSGLPVKTIFPVFVSLCDVKQAQCFLFQQHTTDLWHALPRQKCINTVIIHAPSLKHASPFSQYPGRFYT